MEKTIQNNGETRIRKVLFNEISFVIAVIGCVTGVVFWVANPQQDLKIELTKLEGQVENNNTVAVELQKIRTNDLNEIQLRLDKIETRQIEELKAIAQLEILLKK